MSSTNLKRNVFFIPALSVISAPIIPVLQIFQCVYWSTVDGNICATVCNTSPVEVD